MRIFETERLREKYKVLLPLLDERCLRLWIAAEARSLGHGGIKTVASACGLSRRSVERCLLELRTQEAEDSETVILSAVRRRRPGGGRKTLLASNPNLAVELERLVDCATHGDSMSPLRWTSKSTEKLAGELQASGYRISTRSVAKLLKSIGYSLQAVRKTREGGKHGDRDRQFEHINISVKAFHACGEPVISIDVKKKELVGNLTDIGREWHPQDRPEGVNVYGIIDKELGEGTPCGVLDIAVNEGWVSVGIDHDTAEFAAESIRRWWREMGCLRYPKATRLLVTADGGGSNETRVRLWRKVLQELATGLGLGIHVCHFPPGTSKWNKIDHRMFCQIAQNYRGCRLEGRQVVVNLIGQATTSAGVSNRTEPDENLYPDNQQVSDAEMAAIKITPHKFHSEWNYSINP